MHRSSLLLTLFLFSALACIERSRGARPSVLLIYTDDHAQWAVGAYGNEDVHTPNIDRLATESMRFTQAFTKPVCSPSRAMLLTGQYSHRLAIPDYIPYGNPIHVDNGLPSGTPTIASVLRSAGYATGLVGKWHLGYGEKYYPGLFGFDTAEGYRYISPGKRYDRGGQIPYLIDGSEERLFRKSADVASDCTTILADRAIDFLQTNRDGPFFLYFDTYDMIYLGNDAEKPHMRMIRADDWKLVLFFDERDNPLDDNRHELFNLRSDPGELDNLYGKPSGAQVQWELEAKLRDWVRNSRLAARNLEREIDGN